MRYSKFFGKTQKDTPSDANLVSHQLLHRAGYIRESVAGRYFFLPLGQRVQNKIIEIIREEMNKAEAQEMLSPVLHPMALWKETNRDDSAGFELMSVTDRRGADFALGGTAEEMFTDVVRKFQLSYKDLPFNIYQFSLKFRDEMRARGGLLRVREFFMKDAYSFHKGVEDFALEYKKMWQTYTNIFKRLGLETVVVEADGGYIGGDYCHEFVVISDVGESRFLMTEDGSYAAHEDVAMFKKETFNSDEELKDLVEVDANRGKTMEDGVKLHGLPLWQQLKNVAFVDDKNRIIIACIRGDLDVNECKLGNVVSANELRPATEEEIVNAGSVAGFISPVGLSDDVIIVADDSLKGVRNMYSGANKANKDLLNINLGRDFTANFTADIAMAQAGMLSIDGKVLTEDKGVEVGNIFQLGYHYSNKMKGAEFIDDDGKAKPLYMGCYGIGVGRTMATIVEKFNDEGGIVWPKAIAPFQVHLISIGKKPEEEAMQKAEEIYSKLMDMGVEVIFDDRKASPGAKFADADLIGNPLRIVVSSRSLEKGGVEWKERNQTDSEIVTLNDLYGKIESFIVR